MPPQSLYSAPNPKQPMPMPVLLNRDPSRGNPTMLSGPRATVPLQQFQQMSGKLPIPSLSKPSDVSGGSQGNLANLAFQLPQGSVSKPGLQFVSTGTFGSSGMVGSPGLMTPRVMMTGLSPQTIEKVLVPWGWKRIFMNDVIVYFR